MDISELSNILFDPQGPSKIGIELEIEDEDGNTSPTAHTDLYEFLLNLLIIGINKFDLVPSSENFEYIEVKMQHYFNRINVLLSIDYNNADYYIDDTNIYCKIYIDNSNDDSKLKIVSNPNKQTYNSLSQITGLYILPDSNEIGKKRRLDDNIYGVKISFNLFYNGNNR